MTHAHGSEVVAPIKFLSRIKIAASGTKTLCLFLNFSNFLRAFFSFSVQNLTQQPLLIKTVEIVREYWEVAYFYRRNETSIFDAKIVNLGFLQNMQVGRLTVRNEKCYIIKKEMDK